MDRSTDTSAQFDIRSARVRKPNPFIFNDNVVQMPQKKHVKKNLLLNNAIKTINKKATFANKLKKTSLTNHKANGIGGYKLKNRLNGSATTRTTMKTTISQHNRITKRRYIKRKPKLEADQLTDSSFDDTESNSISNENKNSINLKCNINHTLNHLFTKQPVTKNGKIRGRPRKPVRIDSLFDMLNSHQSINGKNGSNGEQQNNFKNLLEKIHESHQSQLAKLRREIEEREKEILVLDDRNETLKEENVMLRNRITNIINESELSKELESMRSEHRKEISDTKKKLWVSEL